MSGGWANSTGHARTSSAEWKRTRARILERDGRICYLCAGPDADTVEHKVPVHQGGTDEDGNLAAVHDRNPPHCHRSKTSAEGNAARPRQRRAVEPHPGLLDRPS
jgi:5-methylcytosine-specific restriction endonuclease McrA